MNAPAKLTEAVARYYAKLMAFEHAGIDTKELDAPVEQTARAA